MSLRVGIIGAGPSGMAQLRAFESARKNGAQIPEIMCFEKQADWGGQWNSSWRTGLDGHGEPVHSSVYRHLWSNGPKECLEFSDYFFAERFGRAISSFPPREVLFDYIKGRVEKSDVRKYVQFNTVARHASYNPATEEFTLTVEDLTTGTTADHVFDKLVVFNGHFSTPAVPEFGGVNTFPGEVLHAHDFRGAERFSGKNMLMIGSSYSAEDIGMQAHQMGAASLTFSYRRAPMGFDWPENTVERPLVTRFEGTTAHFSDGTQGDPDHNAEADFQSDSLGELIAATDYPPFDLDAVSALFKDWMHHKETNILGYRDMAHRSVITGTMATHHHTRWINAMDDSLQRCLNAPSQDVDTGTLAALTGLDQVHSK